MNQPQVLRRVQAARQQYRALSRTRWYESLVLSPLETPRLWICTPESKNGCHLAAINGDNGVTTEERGKEEKWKSEDGITWFLYHKSNPAERIGSISLFQFTPPEIKLGSAALGYTLSEENRGKGYMSEALGAVVAVVFETLGLRLIEARVRCTNERSRGVVRRSGFKMGASVRKVKWSAENECFNVIETDIWVLKREDWEAAGSNGVIAVKL